jgi:hypothetical protein
LGISRLGTFAAGTKYVYAWISDNANNNTGWVQTDTWGVPVLPSVVSGTPATVTGSPQSFTFTARDPNGAADISIVRFLVNSSPNVPNGTCHGYFDRAANSFFLSSDTLTIEQGPLAPGSAGSLSSSQCTLNGPGSVLLSNTGTDIVIKVTLSLLGTFAAAPKNVYARVTDSSNNDTGWVQTSTWDPSAAIGNQPPAVVSGTPSAPTGSPPSFTFTGRDPNGFANILRMYFLVNPNTSIPPSTCHGFYDRAANALFLYNDGLTVLQGPLTPGTAGTLQNSQCTIHGATSTAGAGTGTDLAVTIGMSLTGAFGTAPRNVYLWVKDAENNDTGWVQTSSWTP